MTLNTVFMLVLLPALLRLGEAAPVPAATGERPAVPGMIQEAA